jgi:hypothetical protein
LRERAFSAQIRLSQPIGELITTITSTEHFGRSQSRSDSKQPVKSGSLKHGIVTTKPRSICGGVAISASQKLYRS